MGALQEKEALRDPPLREGGTVCLSEMARRKLERVVNQIMDWQADELCGEGKFRGAVHFCYGSFFAGTRAR